MTASFSEKREEKEIRGSREEMEGGSECPRGSI